MTNFAYALPDVFPAVRVPALVLNRGDDPWRRWPTPVASRH
jgi:hypothetical protein